MLRLGKERDEINVVSDQIGSPTYATDLAEAILTIVNSKDYQSTEKSTEIYHYSNEGGVSRYGFAKEIFKIARVDCKVNSITTDQYPTLAQRPKNTKMCQGAIAEIYSINFRDWKASLTNFLNKST